jgi:hypothetical protein
VFFDTLLKPIILEAQVDQPVTPGPLRQQLLDGLEKQKRLAGAPDPGKPDHLA